MPSKDELKAFKEWQDSQKTAEQLSQEKITAAENGRTEAMKRAEAAAPCFPCSETHIHALQYCQERHHS